MNDEDDMRGDSEEENGPDIVTCAQCGHPNLAFRNHCRRCGNQLVGAANMVPFVDHLQWTATDGQGRFAPRSSARTIALLMLAFIMIPPLLYVRVRLGPLWFAGAGFGLVLGALAYYRLVSKRKPRADRDTGRPHEPVPVAEPEEGASCHACGATILPIDDICAECGAVVAPDLLE